MMRDNQEAAGAQPLPSTGKDRQAAGIQVNDYAVEMAVGTTLRECGLHLAGNRADSAYLVTDSLFEAQQTSAQAIWIVEEEVLPAAVGIGAVTAGAVAALVARSQLDRLPFTLHSLAEGASPLPHILLDAAQQLPAGLTPRQHELLALLASAKVQDQELSRKLCCAPATVKRDVSSACEAFDLTSKSELANAARTYGYTRATWPGFLHYAHGAR